MSLLFPKKKLETKTEFDELEAAADVQGLVHKSFQGKEKTFTTAFFRIKYQGIFDIIWYSENTGQLRN